MTSIMARDASVGRNSAMTRSVPPVQPLLVLQTPNTPHPDDIGVALDTIVEEYPELGVEQVRHVLGEHTVQAE